MQTKDRPQMDTGTETRDENLSCWKTAASPQCLRIELSDGTQFLLPYGYFEDAKLTRDGDQEILELQFKAHRFIAKGRGLSELFVMLQTLSVEWLRACPPRYRALGKAFIERIDLVEPEE